MVPLIIPRKIAYSGSTPCWSPISKPAIENTAKPVASNTKNAFLSGCNFFWKTKAIAAPNEIINKYHLLDNHDTGPTPIRISLTVPPPRAVTKATIPIPIKSNFLFAAVKAPLIAKTRVPKYSNTCM